MTLIRFTYPKDVALFGAEPIDVHPYVAHVQVVERRRAELVTDEVTEPAPSVCAVCDDDGMGCLACEP